MKATIHTIAKQCGVSSATVSRALRRHPSVKEETMNFICETATSMGYRPNLAAKSLSHNPRTDHAEPTIFIPFNIASVSLFDPFFFDYFCGLIDCLGKEKIPMEIVRFSDSSGELDTARTLVAEQNVAGVFDFHLSPPTLTCFLEANIPIVSSNWREPLKEIPAIIADHIGGYRQAWRHAVMLEHQRVAFFGLEGPLPEHYKECQAAAVMEETVDRLKELILTSDIFAIEANCAALLKQYGPYKPERWPTLFFAQNDFIAARLIKALETLGIAVPGQVSIIGFDDSISAQLHTPTLTTIHKPRTKVGYEMAKLMMEIMHGARKGPDFIRQVPTSLIIRESCGPAPRFVPSKHTKAPFSL